MNSLKHIVFVLSNYKPNVTATSNCAYNVIKHMKNKYDITVICLHHGKDHLIEENIDDVNVIRLRDNYEYFYHLLKGKYNAEKSKTKKLFFFIIFRLLTLINFVMFCFKSHSIRKANISLYYKYLKKVNSEKKIDTIIPVSLGFESVVASYKFRKKNNEVKMIPYLFDPFTFNASLHKRPFFYKMRTKNHLELEQKIFSLSNKIFILPQLEQIMKTSFANFYSKVILTEHPLLEKSNASPIKGMFEDNKKIKIVYTGTLYQSIRNPEYLLTVYQLIEDADMSSQLHMFTAGNCDNILNYFKGYLKESLILHGTVSLLEAQSAMHNADILINLGNTVTYQIPSKIFEYIATGKPIIHFYSHKEDKVIEILESYPLALCLESDPAQLRENSKKFLDFCMVNAGGILNYDQIEKKYFSALPTTTATLFAKYIG